MRKYEKLANEIVQLVGGKENINTVGHCITRLRFKLKDTSIANTEALEATEGVVTVMEAGGQYQVVIGNHVPDVYEEVRKIIGLDVADNDKPEKMKPFDRLVDVLSGTFQPFLAILAGGEWSAG